MKISVSSYHLFRAYRKKGAIVDTNILLLFIVGCYDARLALVFKRTKKYDSTDFKIIKEIIACFSKIIVLPNILTEISNLLGQFSEAQRQSILSALPSHFTVWEELYIPSFDASRWKYFPQFGLTDSAIALLAAKEYLVITDDGRFSALLQGLQIDVVNFNHMRSWPGFQ